MPEIVWGPELLAVLVGAALSLAFNYIPGLRDKYDQLDPILKADLMAGLTILSAIVVFGLSCGGFLTVVGLTCDKAGITQAVWTVILALMANQTTYSAFIRVRANKRTG